MLEAPRNKKIAAFIAVFIMVFVILIGFLLKLFSDAEARSLNSFFFNSTFSSISSSLFLILIGIFSWFVVSKFLLKGKLKKKKK